MNRDILVLCFAWAVTIILLVFFVPRKKIREAHVVFFFKQLLTWLLGLLVVEFRLIEYPVEFFQHATKTSFTFEYFIYPAICVIFNLNYPEGKSSLKQMMYYVSFCTAMSIIEALLEKYTNTIKYVHWSWYYTWITLFITFYASRRYYLWFFKLKTAD